MPAGVNLPVLVGAVPLLYVQNMSISEGYRIQRISGSKFSQAVAPTIKTITIEAILIGQERLALKKDLEVMALTSRALVAATAPALQFTGIPVISGMTISLDMQITELRFNQNVQRRDALDVTIILQHMPRSSLTMIISEAADLALAAGTLAILTGPAPNPIARQPGPPI